MSIYLQRLEPEPAQKTDNSTGLIFQNIIYWSSGRELNTEKLNNREGQTNSMSVNLFTWTTEGLGFYPKLIL